EQFGDVEQFFKRGSDEWSFEECSECQRVPWFCERAGEGDEVLHFLTPPEAFAGLAADVDSTFVEGPFKNVQAAARGREQGDVARFDGAVRQAVAVCDEAEDKVSHCCRLNFASLICILAGAVGHVQSADGDAGARTVPGGQLLITGLEVC